MNKGRKRMHPSMLRSRRKKRLRLPTRPLLDPFLMKNIYTNRKGRRVVIDGARRKSLEYYTRNERRHRYAGTEHTDGQGNYA